MKTYRFKGALQTTGWMENVAITTNSDGIITGISPFDPKEDSVDIINGFAIPGFQNAHSHAFQYAMAGLAEKHGGQQGKDDFWGWREAMYQLALGVNPEQMEAIATMLYSEMLRHGYTNVAEFHYVHHDEKGNPYSNLSEMGSRLVAAANSVGIGITLIPIFYQKGGFGQEPNNRQRRFISPNIDAYLKLWEASQEACKPYRHANIGMGVHSLRGAEPATIVELLKSGPQDIPFHMHIAEQLKEVEDSLQYLGKRPVEWVLEKLQLSDRFHLVHATHMTVEETIGLAQTGANVVLCPSTEGNLGDGLFPLRKYQDEGGKWSIGTDSHIGLNPLEELRILDYGQRLITHKRNTYYSPVQGDSGLYAIHMATRTGRQAMGNTDIDFFKIGALFNAAIIDSAAPLITTSSLQNLTPTIVYASDSGCQLGTISHGKMLKANGNPDKRQRITEKFKKVIKELKNR